MVDGYRSIKSATLTFLFHYLSGLSSSCLRAENLRLKCFILKWQKAIVIRYSLGIFNYMIKMVLFKWLVWDFKLLSVTRLKLSNEICVYCIYVFTYFILWLYRFFLGFGR